MVQLHCRYREVSGLLLAALFAALFPGWTRAATVPEVCTFVIDAFHSDGFSKATHDRSRFYNDYLVRLGVFDVDGDGVPDETQEEKFRGSIGGDQYDIQYSTLPKPDVYGMPWHPDEDESRTADAPAAVRDRLGVLARRHGIGAASAWLPHGQLTYRVGFNDWPAYFLSYVSIVHQGIERPVCLFTNDVREDIYAEGRVEPRLTAGVPPHDFCEQFALPSSLPGLPVTEAAHTRTTFPSNWRTFMSGRVWTVDFDGDGSAEQLAEVTTEAPGGRAAQFTYFRYLDEIEGRSVDPAKVALLGIAQNSIDFDVGTPWFETVGLHAINGRVYFEVSPGGRLPGMGEQNQHRVVTIDHGAPVEVCSGNFSIKPVLLWSDGAAVPPP